MLPHSFNYFQGCLSLKATTKQHPFNYCKDNTALRSLGQNYSHNEIYYGTQSRGEAGRAPAEVGTEGALRRRRTCLDHALFVSDPTFLYTVKTIFTWKIYLSRA